MIQDTNFINSVVYVPASGGPVPLLYMVAPRIIIVQNDSPKAIVIGGKNTLTEDSGIKIDAGELIGFGAADFGNVGLSDIVNLYVAVADPDPDSDALLKVRVMRLHNVLPDA